MVVCGANFIENAIGSDVTNVIDIDLTDSHASEIYNSLYGGDLVLNTTGYTGWAIQRYAIPSGYSKVSGTTCSYNSSGIIIPSLVFLDGEGNIISSYTPANSEPIGGNPGFGYIGTFEDISIPTGAVSIAIQCCTMGITNQALYLTN